MALKASDLYARLKQTQEDAAALEAYWTGNLPIPSPESLDLQNMVRKFPLDHLVTGIEAYATEISKKSELIAMGKNKEVAKPVTTQNAKNYICAVAWNITKDDPKERPLTERRIRNSGAGPDSAKDGEAYQKATPLERQKMMAAVIAREKAKR
jgi:hypothetical protein